MKMKTTNWGLPSRIRLRYLPTGKLLVVSFICSMLISFFHPSVFGQCDPPDLAGVPDDVTVKESYVKTTTFRYVMASSVDTSDYTPLDWSKTEEKNLIERFHNGLRSDSSNFMVSEVLNSSEYFNEYNLPYTHIIVDDFKVHIYQGDLKLGSYLRSQNSADDLINPDTLNDTNGFIETDLGDGLISLDFGDLNLVLDSLNNYEVASRLDSNGSIKSVRFTQFHPTDLDRSVPVSTKEIIKQTKKSGDCYFDIIEEQYSHYCRDDSASNKAITPRLTKERLNTIHQDFSIYPNPSSTELFIDLSSIYDDFYENAELFVFNQLGQVQFRQGNLSKNIIRLDLSSYPFGIYVIRIQNNNTSLVKSFIKQ